MTTEEWLKSRETAADSFERLELYPARERFSPIDWFRPGYRIDQPRVSSPQP